jgi:S-adenosylmethionine synthetase
VTIEYEGDRPVRLDTVVVSTQHAADVPSPEELQRDIERLVLQPEFAKLQLDTNDVRVLELLNRVDELKVAVND